MAFKNTNIEDENLDFDFDSEDTSVPENLIEVSEIIPKDTKKSKQKKEVKSKEKKVKEPKQKKETKNKKVKAEKTSKDLTEDQIKRNFTLKCIGAVTGSFIATLGLITLALYSNDYLSNLVMEKLKPAEHNAMKDKYSGDTPTVLKGFTDKKLNMEDFYNNTEILYQILDEANNLCVKTEDASGKHTENLFVLNKINGVLYEEYEFNGLDETITFEFRDYKDDINTTNLFKLSFDKNGNLLSAESNIPHYLIASETDIINKLIRKFNGNADGTYTYSFVNSGDTNYYLYQRDNGSYYGVGLDEVTGMFREFFNVTNYEELKINPNYKYTYTGGIYNELTPDNHIRYTYEKYDEIYKTSRLNNFNQDDSNSLKNVVNLMLGEKDIDFEIGALYKLDENTTSKQGYKGYNIYIQNKKNITHDKDFNILNLAVNNGDTEPDLYGYIVSSGDNVIVHLKEYRQCEYSPNRVDMNTYVKDTKEDLTFRSRLALVHKMNNAALNSKFIILPIMVHDDYYNDEMTATVIGLVNPEDNTVYKTGLIIKPWDVYGQPVDISGYTKSELGINMGSIVNTNGYINNPSEVVVEDEEIALENIGLESDGTMIFKHPTLEGVLVGVNKQELIDILGSEPLNGDTYNIKYKSKDEKGNNIMLKDIISIEKLEISIEEENTNREP